MLQTKFRFLASPFVRRLARPSSGVIKVLAQQWIRLLFCYSVTSLTASASLKSWFDWQNVILPSANVWHRRIFVLHMRIPHLWVVWKAGIRCTTWLASKKRYVHLVRAMYGLRVNALILVETSAERHLNESFRSHLWLSISILHRDYGNEETMTDVESDRYVICKSHKLCINTWNMRDINTKYILCDSVQGWSAGKECTAGSHRIAFWAVLARHSWWGASRPGWGSE